MLKKTKIPPRYRRRLGHTRDRKMPKKARTPLHRRVNSNVMTPQEIIRVNKQLAEMRNEVRKIDVAGAKHAAKMRSIPKEVFIY